ncbi:beta-lactamase family protein [bacterium]|nr:beta-lactamase family protein [bacterium]MBU4510540.1 beta-lactamase family protein [bacterium]
MKKILSILAIIILIVLCLFAFTSFGESPAGSPEPEGKIEEELKILMDSVIAESHVPGLVAGIWAPDKGVSFIYTAGVSDLETNAPIDEDMIFRIGSNTKTFTITVLLQLVDEGLINLSDPLSKYLPEYPRADEVSIEMLTNMRSGIYNYSESEYFSSKMFEDPTLFWLPEELIAITEEHPYYFEPGTDFHYSNTNTIIVGEIIEMVTGNSLESEINKRIIDKLGLKNTSYLNGGVEIPGYHPKAYYAGDYDPDFIECSEWLDCSWAGAAGSIVSNIFELKIYVEALVDGYFLSDELQQSRLKGHEMPGSNKKYGMGIFSYDNFYGHNGGYPGFTSLMMHSSERNCTIIIWYNCQLDEATPTMLLPEVAKIIYPDIE